MSLKSNSQLPTPYRSPGLPRQYFSQPGNMHMHVDGGGNATLVTDMLKDLERSGAKGKINAVLGAVAGPQRLALPGTYASHTPGQHTEQFEYFATVNVGTLAEAEKRVSTVLKSLGSTTGVVVEVEQVVARIDAGGTLSWLRVDHESPLDERKVGFKGSPTLPFEIHHGFDIVESEPALNLDALIEETSRLGVTVGGWFVFSRHGHLAYRSNAFADSDSVEAVVVREHAKVTEFLESLRLNGHVRSVVERVLGIWRTPALVV